MKRVIGRKYVHTDATGGIIKNHDEKHYPTDSAEPAYQRFDN
jgi:hypothetical protein